MRNHIRFFSAISILLLSAGVGVFYVSSLSADNVQNHQSNSSTPAPKTPSTVVNSATVDGRSMKNTSVSQATVMSDKEQHLHDHDHDHDHQASASANPAADLQRLPIPMQQQIKELTSRDELNRTYQTIEVEPGIVAVMINNGPRVVPVAVMNEDGTVSIHEY